MSDTNQGQRVSLNYAEQVRIPSRRSDRLVQRSTSRCRFDGTFRFISVDSSRDRQVPIRVYLPEQVTAQPLILFSHGLGGAKDNNRYLAEHWRQAGYVCVFMQHIGSDESVWKSASNGLRKQKLVQAANGKSFLDRNKDVSFIIDQLTTWNAEEGHPFYGRCDLEHIGMSGHSFGAVTTLALTGRAFPFGKDFLEPRIDAFLAMSPQTSEGLSAKEAFGRLSQPILCMTGTQDDSPISDRTTPASRREVYAAMSPGDKYELVYDGGVHSTFSDTRRTVLAKTRNTSRVHQTNKRQILGRLPSWIG